ncbi:MAG: hypothetical protein WCF95_03650 [bacterium]
MEVNQNYSQALNSVPYYNVAQQDTTRYAAQDTTGYAAQQAPIAFGAAPRTEVPAEGGGLSLGKILGIGALAIGAIATHKGFKLNSIMQEAVEKGVITKEAKVPGLLESVGRNLNPLNWFGNKEALEKLATKESGLEKIEGLTSGRLFKNAEGDVIVFNHKKDIFNSKTGEAYDPLKNIINKAEEVTPGIINQEEIKVGEDLEKRIQADFAKTQIKENIMRNIESNRVATGGTGAVSGVVKLDEKILRKEQLREQILANIKSNRAATGEKGTLSGVAQVDEKILRKEQALENAAKINRPAKTSAELINSRFGIGRQETGANMILSNLNTTIEESAQRIARTKSLIKESKNPQEIVALKTELGIYTQELKNAQKTILEIDPPTSSLKFLDDIYENIGRS